MTAADPITDDLLKSFDLTVERVLARLEGLTGEEYFWEPVPECMTVRRGDDGVFRADPLPPKYPVPAPFTTIAWRMYHIGSDCLRCYLRFFGGEAPEEDPRAWPGAVPEAVATMTEDWSRFRARIAGLGDERLMRPMGELGGFYRDETYLQLGLHALDEVAHHGAELGLLRDLYLHRYSRG